MKEYFISILETAKEDGDQEKLIAFDEMGYLINHLESHLSEAAPRVLKIMKSTHEDLEEKYSIAYRNCYFCLGLSKILRFKKLIRLFSVLEFVVDCGRINQDFSKYSLIYVADLIFKTSEKILHELARTGSCSFDISHILLECGTYLREPLENYVREFHTFANEDHENVASFQNYGESSEKLSENTLTGEAQQHVEDVLASSNLFNDPEYLNLSDEKLKLVGDFCDEASDNLQIVELALIELEDRSDPGEKINEIFRCIHTVKGGSRLLEVKKIESLAHELENLLDDLRNKKIQISGSLIDALIEGNNALIEMVEFVRDQKPISTILGDIIQKIKFFRGQNTSGTDNKSYNEENIEPSYVLSNVSPSHSQKVKEPLAEENIRVPASKLDEVLNTASEVFINRIRLQNDTQIIADAIASLDKLMKSAQLDRIIEDIKSVRERCVDLELQIISHNTNADSKRNKSRRFLKQISDVLEAEIFLNLEKFPEDARLTLRRIEELKKNLQKNVDDLEGLSGRLQTGAMGFRMIPIAQLFNRFPAQVRELSRKLGKKVKLTISGADTELDKLLINQLADPLLHIIRNSLDHGFEDPEIRKKLGKSEIGEIKISAFYQGSNAVIEIIDDGSGINKTALIDKALRNKLITNEDLINLSEKQTMDLLFAPGLSTASEVTELSGRGVGMDVVKTAIAGIQGTVQIESKEKVGTKVSVKLPLTLAIVGVLLVSENGHNFALPVLNVVEVLEINSQKLKQVGDNVVFNYRGKTLNVNALSKFLDFSPSAFDQEQFLIIVLTDGDRHLGVIVDEIKGRQEVLIKQFGSLLSKINYVMGCTILSDSSLVLILNVWELISEGSNSPLQLGSLEKGTNKRSFRALHKVLVVDDSSMQRSRMSAILKRAGYDVETAVDGHDALQKIKTSDYSVFCVDIVMPLMDGYEFVEQLKNVEGLIDPVIFLITGKKIGGGAETRRFEALNVQRLFQKPVNEEELISALDRACLSDKK